MVAEGGKEGAGGVSKSESPIEEKFLWALRYVVLKDWHNLWTRDDGDGPFTFLSMDELEITVDQQFECDPYRLDFLLTSTRFFRGFPIQVAVEIDGHEWHERTKEQAARDRKRDRDLLRRGIHTVRFTGSEVYSDADGCALEALRTVEALLRSRDAEGRWNFHAGRDWEARTSGPVTENNVQ